jgi:hypothetical protein
MLASSPGDRATAPSPPSSAGSDASSPSCPPRSVADGSASSPLSSGSVDSNSSAELLRFREELLHLREARRGASRQAEEAAKAPVVVAPVPETTPGAPSDGSTFEPPRHGDLPGSPNSAIEQPPISHILHPSPRSSAPSSESNPERSSSQCWRREKTEDGGKPVSSYMASFPTIEEGSRHGNKHRSAEFPIDPSA